MPDMPVRFLTEAPLVTFRRIAEAELRKVATPAQLTQLHANPLLWCRALVQIRRDVQNHIAKDRRHLADLKPAAGQQPSDAYLAAKNETDTQAARRLHFARIVERRLEEVYSLLGPGPAPTRMSVGEVIGVLVEISELAEQGDLRSVREKSRFHASRWAEAYGLQREEGRSA